MTYIKKKDRITVWHKFNCRCSYCGSKLEYKQLQVDHIEARWHNLTKEECKVFDTVKCEHTLENFNPSCARCNRWKGTFSIEQFRIEIQKQTERLKRDSPAYIMASDFGMINEDNSPIVFYFEKFNKNEDNNI